MKSYRATSPSNFSLWVVDHVPKKWSNKRVKEELGDLIPIDKVKSVPKKNVKKKDKVD